MFNRKNILKVLLGTLCLVIPVDFLLARDSIKKLAHWPLNDGIGEVVVDTVGKVNGLFRTKDPTKKLTWNVDGQKNVLVFPGSEKQVAGHLEIDGGGSILSGPVFAVGLDVFLESDWPCILLAAKHKSTKTGGFILSYWAGARKLTFDFSDGKDVFSFETVLNKKLPLKQWVSISITYDSTVLSVLIDGKVVKTFDSPGHTLAKSRYPILVGGYFSKIIPGSFQGKIRNLWLGTPIKIKNRKMLYNSRVVQAAPVIDGNLDDACWKDASFVGDFVKFFEGRIPAAPTEFAVAYGPRKVYLAIRCTQPKMDQVKSQKRGEVGQICEDESIEIFIDPDYSQDHYYQMALNLSNSHFDTVITNFGNNNRTDFNMAWDSAVMRHNNSWTAEIAIPYSQLLVRPDNPGYWRFNVCRNDSTAGDIGPYSTWGRIQPGDTVGYHNFKIFGTLLGLPKPRYTAAEAKQVRLGRVKWKLDKKPVTDEIGLFPIHDPLMVANNMVVPNILGNKALGPVVNRRKAYYHLDIPDGIQLLAVGDKYRALAGGAGQFKMKVIGPVTHDGKQFTRHEIRPGKMHHLMGMFGSIFMKSTLAENTRTEMFCQALWDGGRQKPLRIGLLVKTFPTPGMPKKLYSSLAWMFGHAYFNWPDFLETYQKLGFNTFGTHYTYDRYVPVDQRAKLFDRARADGMKIVLLGSPFHNMLARKSPGHSIRPDGSFVPATEVCPAFRGEDYQVNLQRIAEATRQFRPDIIQLDIECYHKGGMAGRTGLCTRCSDYIAKSGKKPAEAMTDLGTEIMMDVKKTITRVSKMQGFPTPALGNYHNQPGGFVYQEIFSFDKMYAAGAVDNCHPVFYQSAKALASGQEIRVLRKLLDKGAMIPWMTTGYGIRPPDVQEYPSPWVYDYVLEAYGSGVRGIYWFAFLKFEAADFYYHAKAMGAVNPVSAMIYDSKPLEGISDDSESVSVTGLQNGKEVLLLVSDYKDPSAKTVKVTLPREIKGVVWDLARKQVGGTLDGKTATIRFSPGSEGAHCALYYLGPERPK